MFFCLLLNVTAFRQPWIQQPDGMAVRERGVEGWRPVCWGCHGTGLMGLDSRNSDSRDAEGPWGRGKNRTLLRRSSTPYPGGQGPGFKFFLHAGQGLCWQWMKTFDPWVWTQESEVLISRSQQDSPIGMLLPTSRFSSINTSHKILLRAEVWVLWKRVLAVRGRQACVWEVCMLPTPNSPIPTSLSRSSSKHQGHSEMCN